MPLEATTPACDTEVIVTRLLDAPRALVWKAWTEPEHVVRWWGPEGFESSRCKIDLTVGGTFRLFMRGPDGTVYPCTGVFREIVPLERLVFEGDPDGTDACGAGLPPGARVTVTFEKQDGKTRLTIEARFDTAAACLAAMESGYAPGWGETLGRLAADLETM